MQKLRLAAIGLATSLVASMASAALSVADLSAPGDGLLTVDAETGLGWLDITATRGMALDQVAGGAWIQQGFRLASAAEFDTLVSHGVTQPDVVNWLGAWAASPEISAYVGGPTSLLAGVVGADGPRDDGLVRVEKLMLTRGTTINLGEPAPPRPSELDGWVDAGAPLNVTGPVLTKESLLQAGAIGGDMGGQTDPLASGAYSQAFAALQLSEQQTQLTTRLMGLVASAPPGGVDMGTFLRRHTTWTSPLATSPDVGVFLVKEVSVVPEPSALALMGIGLVGVFSLTRRRSAAVG